MLLDRKRKFDIKKLIKKINNRNVYKNFFMFIMGLLISSIGVSVFYEPNNIAATGSTGVAILITKFVDIDLSLLVFALGSVLLVIGFAVFGINYGAKNIFITILSPVFIKAATILNDIIKFDNASLFLLTVVAGILSGIGNGLIKKSGYNQGGFGVIYDFLSSKFKISVGKASLIVNTCILILNLFLFGFETGIYGFIALYISSMITDRVMIGISNNKAFYIITNKPLEVREYIINTLHHTVTLVNAKGGYSDKKKKMLLCVIPTIEYTKVKEVVKEIDKNVFFLITDGYYVSK